MKISRLIGGAALGGLLLAGAAYAAVSSTSAPVAPKASSVKQATATWAMGCEHALIEGVASREGLTLSYNRGAGVDEAGTVNIGGDVMTQFTVNGPKGNSKGDQYAEFVVSPSASFTPKVISFEFINVGWGDGRYALEVICGSTTKTLIDISVPIRDSASDVTAKARTVSSAVEGITATPAEPLKVRVYFSAKKDYLDRVRSYALGNMVISGDLEVVEVPEVPDTDPVPTTPVDVPADWKGEVAPGQFNISEGYPWTFTGTRYQACNSDLGPAHIAYVKGGTSCSTEFYCKQAGVYTATYKMCNTSNPGTITLSAIDIESGNVEAKGVFPYNKESEFTVMLEGKLSTGAKKLEMSFAADHTGYIGNFHAPELKLVGYEYAGVTGITVDDVVNTPLEGYDYNFILPADYAEEEVVLNLACRYATITAGDYPVNVRKITVPAPQPSEATVVDITATPFDGAASPKTDYKVRLYRIGGVVVNSLLVNDTEVGTEELLEAINGDEGVATLAGRCYTAVPAVKVVFADGSKADAAVTLEGTTAKAAFSGKSGKDSKSFTLSIEGIHLFEPAEGDKTVKLVYDTANNKADGSWSNGLYTLRNSNDGWGGTQFKFKSNIEHTWSVPSNVVVKQMRFCQLGDNYAAGTVEYVSSEGATVYLPSDNDFSNNKARYDLVVNIENHSAGQPIAFKFKDGSQPVAWFEFVVEELPLTGTPELTEAVTTPELPLSQNHCIVTLTFDRPMAACTATYADGLKAKAEGEGTPTLKFSLWNLAWNTDNAFTIAQGDLKDVDGNAYPEPVTFEITVGAPAAAEPVAAENVTIVSNIDELTAAIASCMETNKTADAPRRVIFMKNGDYNLGSSSEAKAMLHLNKAFNVSIIGESRDGVVLRGSIEGISYPVFSTRYSTNIYMENFTIRNDLDYGTTRKGVGVAHYGGNRDIMVNMLLLSQQDTQVTGEQGYYYNCEIHGTVDYICGGGNHFYDHCLFVQQSAGAITAPSTSPLLKWGYVFQNCTIKGASGYTLGRPWKDEPRCYWLNTTMLSAVAPAGWGSMGNLPTHFYEYNSMDKDGKALDLSKRTNSPTSTNKYTPVLTAEEAAEFTVENVLGGSDSWYAPGEYVVLDAPAVSFDKDANAVAWTPDTKAAGYMVYRLGEIVAYVPGNVSTYEFPAAESADATYTVRAMSANGTLSEHSAAVSPSGTVGIDGVEAENGSEAIYYDLRGVRVSDHYRGVTVKVSRGEATKNVKL